MHTGQSNSPVIDFSQDSFAAILITNSGNHYSRFLFFGISGSFLRRRSVGAVVLGALLPCTGLLNCGGVVC